MTKKLLALALVPFLSGCGLVFVKGPPTGWQGVEDADQLEISAIRQPCTTSKSLVWLDGLGAAYYFTNAIFSISAASDPGAPSQTGTNAIVNAIAGAITTLATVRGNRKANDCRAFNARLLQERRGNEQAQASHEWLDGLFPLRDLGVTAFDPVFGLPIKQGH